MLIAPGILLIINATLVALSSVLILIVVNLSVRFSRAVGDIDIQQRLQRRILRLLILLVVIVISAAAVNLLTV